jgi:patatin-like phospholipase/acyl hydrolase
LKTQDEDSPLNQTGLCLLSLGMKIIHTRPNWQITNVDLDGGGVRGLSTLLILKALMAAVNDGRIKAGQSAIKPCELFDLIGGTSTGG